MAGSERWRRWATLACALAAFTMVPPQTWAQPLGSNVIDEVTAEHGDRCTVIHVRFVQLFRYVRHTPEGPGRELVIQLQPLRVRREESEPVRSREAAVVPTGGALIDEVVYEGDIAGGPYLRLSFDGPFLFEVRQGRNLHQIDITVRPPAAGEGPRRGAGDCS